MFEALQRLSGDEAEAARMVQEAGAFVFCAAPGSILGIRTCAMAIRMWTALRARPVCTYHALELLAAARGKADEAFIADARRGRWHWARSGVPAEVLAEEDLAARAAKDGLNLATPENFRTWAALPPQVRAARYNIGELWTTAAPLPLLSFTSEPDARIIAEPSYARWTPRLHQAANPP